MSDQEKNQRLWVGILLVSLGGLFLVRNLDIIPYFLPDYLFSWKMIFVIIGTGMLISKRKEGVVFLALGTIFLFPDILYDLNFSVSFSMSDWWPLFLIAGGAVIILRRKTYIDRDEMIGDNGYFEDTSVFGGSDKSFSSDAFKGGKITAVFGGSAIDLSMARMYGNEAIIDYFAMFGGNEIRVPEDWTIINEGYVIFGGYDDKRKSGVVPDPDKVLKIKGTTLFGGFTVKS